MLYLIMIGIFFFYSQTFAQDLNSIFKDLSPISALVISVEGEEVILDKGSQHGIKQGDIFSVYKIGKEIVHPITKKIIGRRKELVAKIQVKEVERDFSTAIVLSKKESFDIGALAVRYADLSVLLLVKEAKSSQFLALLQNRLPQLTFRQIPWIDFSDLSSTYLAKEQIDLVCVLEGGLLRLYDSRLNLLKVYSLQPLTVEKSITHPSIQSYISHTVSLKERKNINFRRIKRLPYVIVDFETGDVDNDGKAEVVYLTPQALLISKLSTNSQIGKYKYKGFGKILNFSLGPNGWIALNTFVDREGFRAYLLRFTPEGLKTVVSHIKLLLGFFDLNGDGIKETLLGQTFEQGEIFGSRVYRLQPKGNKLVLLSRKKVPYGFRLLGATFADLDGDGRQEVISEDLGHRLQIFKGYNKGYKKVWISNQKVGGSIYTVKASIGISRPIYKLSISSEPDLYPVDINGDGHQEVLIISNKSSHGNLFPGIPFYSSSSVLILTHTSMGYELLPASPPFNGPIQGLGIVRGQVIVSLVNGNPFTQKGETSFLAFPLMKVRDY